MKSHVIAYRSVGLLFGTHTFHFNCFFDDFNCVFTQIRCLSRVLLDFNCLKLKYKVLKLGVWMSDPYLYYNSIERRHAKRVLIVIFMEF